MLWNLLVWTADIFDPAMMTVMVICGLWSFWMVRPAMAEKGLERETRVAAAGGFLYLAAVAVIFVTLRVAQLFLPL